MIFNGKAEKSSGILPKNDFDVVATVDNVAITKYDLNNFIVLAGNGGKKSITNKQYNDALERYMETIKKRIIAEKNKITLTEEEKKQYLVYFFQEFKH